MQIVKGSFVCHWQAFGVQSNEIFYGEARSKEPTFKKPHSSGHFLTNTLAYFAGAFARICSLF
jgi:hypothetical protein